MVLLVVSLSILGYLYLTEIDKGYRFVALNESQGSDARMVLSTGEEIALKKDNSTITLNDVDGQVTVNDSIIDLKENVGTGNKPFQ